MAHMKEQTKTSEKNTKQNRDKQLIRCRVQNTGGKGAQRPYRVWQMHKGRKEGTLSEIKNNLQANNGRVDEARIK